MLWRLRLLMSTVLELLAMFALPFGGTGAALVLWIRDRFRPS
jgi:hypothetical protein